MWCRRVLARAPQPGAWLNDGYEPAAACGNARVADRSCVGGNDYRLCSNSIRFWLACAEGYDAPDWIVRRDADGHAISRNYLDAEAAHSAAELGEHFVAGVALHAV